MIRKCSNKKWKERKIRIILEKPQSQTLLGWTMTKECIAVNLK